MYSASLQSKLRSELGSAYLSEAFAQTKTNLRHCILNNTSLITVTGIAGVGKTTLVRETLHELSPDYFIVRINQPQLTANELLQAILFQLGHETALLDSKDLFSCLVGRIQQIAERNQQLLAVIDDAQMMDNATLEQCQQLLAGCRGNLQVLLCGRPILLTRMSELPVHIESTAIHELTGLNFTDIEPYIRHCFFGDSPPSEYGIDQNITTEIFHITRGNPKSVNTICNAVLDDSQLQPSQSITLSSVRDARRNIATTDDGRDEQISLSDPHVVPVNPLPKLIAMCNSLVVASVELQPGTLSIGRANDNDLKLSDSAVSRYHCKIFTGSDGSTIEDLGSVNGLFINSKPTRRSALCDQDIVSIGQHRLIFHSGNLEK